MKTRHVLFVQLMINHQRMWQYAGGHYETWGGVALNIDCDVIDGIVVAVTPAGLTHKVYLPAVVRDSFAP